MALEDLNAVLEYALGKLDVALLSRCCTCHHFAKHFLGVLLRFRCVHEGAGTLRVALENLDAILEYALGEPDVALLSRYSTCHHFAKHFLGVLLRFRCVHEGAGTLRVALENLDAILEYALGEPDVALLSRYSTLRYCLICLTNYLGEIQCCLAGSVFCH